MTVQPSSDMLVLVRENAAESKISGFTDKQHGAVFPGSVLFILNFVLHAPSLASSAEVP